MKTLITNVCIKANNGRVLKTPCAQAIILGNMAFNPNPYGSKREPYDDEDKFCALQVCSEEGNFAVPLKDVYNIDFEIHSEKKKTYVSIRSSIIAEEENNE